MPIERVNIPYWYNFRLNLFQKGDTVECEIDEIGCISNTVEEAANIQSNL